ncbi:ATP-binding protein [Clostridium sp. D43t1_170807_H7]|uniref:ATP-binding protein n=1 Tax=Clostridium sp. D43t1_170807_H7 TaxID=2787140 RepID=UPI00189B2D58|nr:ATP-binding protein [Clostridium sp. D43t1_170807_H7]
MNDKKIDILISYYKDKLGIIMKFIVFIGIFFIVYSLYHLPLGVFLYASLLVVTLGFLFSLYDFNNYYNKHKILVSVLNEVEFSMDKLSKSNSLIYKDYENIIKALYKNKTNLKTDLDFKYENIVNYYTMWVHQIKTPISAFFMIVQSMDASPEKAMMKQELFKINEYVDMVLYYIRLDTLNYDLKLQEYELKDIIQSAIKKYSATFIYKKIALKLEEINCKIITDKKWTTFIIEQIVSNSLKYTTQGSISIYLDKDSDNTLVIEDTGIGIEKEDIPQIFEKGFTGYNGRSDKKSTGIGLYLCKEIATRLSHKLYATSKVGVGTKVYIDFSINNIKIK